MPQHPNFESTTIAAQRLRWHVLDDVWGGTETLRAKREIYLPKGPAETADGYERRLTRARFYNVFRRAVKGLAGIVLEEPPTLADELPGVLRQDAMNIDGQGSALPVFARTVLEQGLRHGWGLIFVDAPKVNTATLTAEDAKRLGVRPYWIHIPATKVRNIRTRLVGSVVVVDQITWEESAWVEDGPYGMKEEPRLRVVGYFEGRPGWEVWRVSAGGQELAERGWWERLDAPPVALFEAGERTGVAESDPPLWDLAETNLDHYVVQNEHRHALHVASVPVPVFKGIQAESAGQTVLAPDMGIVLPVDGDAFYLEHSGAALTQTREELKDLEGRMANQSLAMLTRETRSAETAEAKRIDLGVQHAQISVVATGLKDAMERALQFHAALRGVALPALDAIVRVQTDFDDFTVAPGDLAAYSDLVTEGRLSLETLWELLRRAKRLPRDFDAKAEVERLQQPILPTPDPVDLGDGDTGDDDAGDDDQIAA